VLSRLLDLHTIWVGSAPLVATVSHGHPALFVLLRILSDCEVTRARWAIADEASSFTSAWWLFSSSWWELWSVISSRLLALGVSAPVPKLSADPATSLLL
jgi:hypothetical protein